MHTISKTNLIEFKNSTYLFDIVESDETVFLLNQRKYLEKEIKNLPKQA
jgi:hypothetical protein